MSQISSSTADRPMIVRAFQIQNLGGDGQVTDAELAPKAEIMQSRKDGQQGCMRSLPVVR